MWFVNFCAETCSVTAYDSHDVSASDLSFQTTTSLPPARPRPRHRVSFGVDARSTRSSSSTDGTRRPPLPPDRRAAARGPPPPGHGHLRAVDPRSLRHLQHRAHQRAMRTRSWHSLTTPPSAGSPSNDVPRSPTDLPPPAREPPASSGAGKFRFLSLLFAKKSAGTQSAAESSFGVDRQPTLRPARRGAAGASLPRSASAGRIADVGGAGSSGARPARTVRWNISPDMDKTVVIPTWKRPKKVLVQESSV